MIDESYATVIIGAGISGLACARTLYEQGRDFFVISDDIGGRILTSADGTINYGAFFVCKDYHHVLKYVQLHSRIKLRDFCFHENNKIYVLFETKLIKHFFQFLIVLKLLFRFKKALHKLRKMSEVLSQKESIEKDSFLLDLYNQKASIFIEKYKISEAVDVYLSKGLYSTTFSEVCEMNAFSFLEFLLPLITPIYTFTFDKEKMIEPFKEKIICRHINSVVNKDGKYEIKTADRIFYAKNVVLATQIDYSKKISDIKITNKPVSTNMLHIKGEPKDIISRKTYHLFSPSSNVQAVAKLFDGTYLLYYKHKCPQLEGFFYEPSIIAHKYWNPAGTINGHILIENNRGNNLYLIGDFNVCGLEDAYITGIYAANQICRTY